jgi:hypothetical protein
MIIINVISLSRVISLKLKIKIESSSLSIVERLVGDNDSVYGKYNNKAIITFSKNLN